LRDEAASLTLYRVVQECLTNVVRHAHASTCVVSLEVAHEARLEVHDNGRGTVLDCDLRGNKKGAWDIRIGCVVQRIRNKA